MDDVLSDDQEMGVMVETAVYKHIVTFFQTVSTVHIGYYRTKEAGTKVTSAFVVTKSITDYGISKYDTPVPILRIPALTFTYLIGMAEANGQEGKF